MERLTWLALVVCVASVLGEGHEGHGEPERCCIKEEQFTIKKSVQSGVVGIGFFSRFRGQLAVFENAHLAFDYTNGKVAGYLVRRVLNGEGEEHVHVIADLESSLAHVISPYEEECSLEDLDDVPFFPYRCISEIAFWSGNATFGRGLTTDTWTTYFPDERRSPVAGVYSVNVHHESCIPMSETFAGRSRSWGRNQQIVTSAGYYDFSKGISEEAMEKFFTLPEYCKQEMDHVLGGEEHEMDDVLGGEDQEDNGDHHDEGEDHQADKPRKH